MMNNQPNIVISPTNNAGWREVLIGIHSSLDKKQILSDAEQYLVEDLMFRQNNDKRKWRWERVHVDSFGMRFFVANVRNTLEDEEE